MLTYTFCFLLVVFAVVTALIPWLEPPRTKEIGDRILFCMKSVWFGGVALLFLTMAGATVYDKIHDEPIRNHEDAIGVRMTISKIKHFRLFINDSCAGQSWEVFCKKSEPGYSHEYVFYTTDSTAVRGIAIGDTGRVYNLNQQWKSTKYPRQIIVRGRQTPRINAAPRREEQ